MLAPRKEIRGISFATPKSISAESTGEQGRELRRSTAKRASQVSGVAGQGCQPPPLGGDWCILPEIT
jgi:hypothetical protein